MQQDINRENMSKKIETLRADILFSNAESFEDLPPMAEQYHLLALSALEQAMRFASLSNYHYMRKK